MAQGFFITFEGIDSSGKSTQLRQLAGYLESKGVPYLVTREPGGTALGQRIRELVLAKDDQKMTWMTELLLMAADRAQHVEELIKPALEDGLIVLCDRYIDSSAAYQGYGLGGDLALIEEINQLVTGGLVPHLTILLDVDPSVCLARAQDDDRIGGRGLAFQTRVREGYQQIAAKHGERFLIIDGQGTAEGIHRQILHVLRTRWPQRFGG
ncbi:MAG: dTMP kinase [Limnochordia bacterium]|jgi:dTMP kinase